MQGALTWGTGTLDGGARRPHEIECVSGATGMPWVHKHVTVRIVIWPDNAAQPIIVAKIIADLRVEGRFLGFESNRVEFVQDHASKYWSRSKTECTAFPEPGLLRSGPPTICGRPRLSYPTSGLVAIEIDTSRPF